MLSVINDLHIGALRATGTTLTSQWELRQHLLRKFKSLLPASGDLMILGDLFDLPNIPIFDVYETYKILREWHAQHVNSTVWLVAGNHDLSRTSTTMSSFDFLCALLELDNSKMIPVKSPTVTPHGYAIPHLANQGLFDEALANVPADTSVLYLHCNYDNFFAVESDQSLNLSKEQAATLSVQSIVLGHEHHPRRIGKVFIPGNQVASSVADWQGQRVRFHVTVEGATVTLNPLPDEQEYAEVDWKELAPTDHKFVRVTGTATTAEAASVITAIAKHRQTSQAFVVSNAVKIATDENGDVFENALETAHSFDVMAALKELLTADEILILENLPDA